MSSGKTWLARQSFTPEVAKIDLDDFIKQSDPNTTPYIDAIDRASLNLTLDAELRLSPVVVVLGAVAWPLVQLSAMMLGEQFVRRIYIKRMMRGQPDYWQDEYILDDDYVRRPTSYGRSIDSYHAEQRPWLIADLVLERIESDDER